MTEEKKKIDEVILPEKAKEVLLAERQKRESACQNDLKALLEKHKCVIEIGMLVTPQGNRPQIAITAQ